MASNARAAKIETRLAKRERAFRRACRTCLTAWVIMLVLSLSLEPVKGQRQTTRRTGAQTLPTETAGGRPAAPTAPHPGLAALQTNAPAEARPPSPGAVGAGPPSPITHNLRGAGL